MKARAVWFDGPRSVDVRTEEVKPPGDGEILVRARVSLISAGTELVVYRGEAAADDPMPLYGQGSYTFPVKYGYQVVGVVEESRSALAVGQRVFVRHPHQDLFTVAADPAGVVAVPDGVPDEHAAFLNLARVATTAQWDAPTVPGDVAVVFGLGVVGTLCARLARRSAGTVIVVDPVESRRAHAVTLNVDAAVTPDDAATTIAELSHGRGADVVYETSGVGAALQAAIDCAGQEATVCVVSYYGRTPVPLRLAPEFHWRRLRIVSSHQSMLAWPQPRWDTGRRNAAVFADLAALGVADLVSDRVPVDDAGRA